MSNNAQTTNASGLDLTAIKKESTWDHLIEIQTETMANINGQMLLVNELRAQYKDELPKNIDDAFNGLLFSFSDLLMETIKTSLRHAGETEERTIPAGDTVLVPKSYYSGALLDDDHALTYINVASSYLNIQEKTVSLISMGWVDLFVKLKLPVDNIQEHISMGIANMNAVEKESTNATKH